MRPNRPPAPARDHQDRRGIAWNDTRLLLPSQVALWPKYPPRRKEDDKRLQNQFHLEFRGSPCWLCGDRQRGKELHHLFAGSKGRSHERELFTWLCARPCHADVLPRDLSQLLWTKWKFDNAWCDWELLLIRHGHWFDFDELEVPAWYRNGVLQPT